MGLNCTTHVVSNPDLEEGNEEEDEKTLVFDTICIKKKLIKIVIFDVEMV